MREAEEGDAKMVVNKTNKKRKRQDIFEKEIGNLTATVKAAVSAKQQLLQILMHKKVINLNHYEHLKKELSIIETTEIQQPQQSQLTVSLKTVFLITFYTVNPVLMITLTQLSPIQTN